MKLCAEKDLTRRERHSLRCYGGFARTNLSSGSSANPQPQVRANSDMTAIHTPADFVRSEIRKAFADSLDKFIPSFQFPPPVLEKLELFRSQTLAQLDPPSKGQEAANAAMNELLDSTVGLHNFFVPDIPVSNTRAGLYIYIHAAVSFLALSAPRRFY